MSRRERLIWAFAALLILGSSALAWLLASEAGLRAVTRVLAERAGVELEIEGLHGSVLGGARIERLLVEDARWRIAARRVTLTWRPWALWAGRLSVDELAAEELSLVRRGPIPPSVAPDDLRLPLAVDLRRLHVTRLHYATSEWRGVEVSRVDGSFASDGRNHQLNRWRAELAGGVVTLSARLDGVAPFPASAVAHVSGQLQSLPISAEVAADGPLQQLRVRAQAAADSMRADGEALIAAFAAQPILRLALRAESIDPARVHAAAPKAALQLNAEFSDAGHGLSGIVEVDNRQPGPVDSGALPFANIRAELVLAGRRVDVPVLRGKLPGDGEVWGKAHYAAGSGEATLAIEAMDLARLFSVARPTRLHGQARLAGSVSRQTLEAELADARLAASMRLAREAGRVDVERIRVRAAKAQFDASGYVELAGARSFKAAGSLQGFDPSRFVQLPPMNLTAEIAATGHLAQPTAGELDIKLGPSRIGNAPLAGWSRARLSPGRLDRVDVSLSSAGNRISIAGAFGATGDRLDFDVVMPELRSLRIGAAGRIRAHGHLVGSFDAPAGSAEVAVQGLSLASGSRIEQAQGTVRLGAGMRGELAAEMAASGLHIGPPSSPVISALRLSISGTRDAHRLAVRMAAQAQAALDLQLRGGFGKDLAWSGSLEALRLQHRTQTLELAAPAVLNLARGAMSLGSAEFRAAHGRLRLAETRYASGQLFTRGDARGIAIADWMLPWTGLDSGTLRVSADWELRAGEHLDGRIAVRREDGDILLRGDSAMALGLERAGLIGVLRRDELRVEMDVAAARLGRLGARLAARLAGSGLYKRLAEDAPLDGQLNIDGGRLDTIPRLFGPAYSAGGSLSGALRLGGTVRAARLDGSLVGSQLEFSAFDAGLRLHDGRLSLKLDGDELRLEELSFAAAPGPAPRFARIDFAALRTSGGRLSATGRYRYSSRSGELDLRAERLAVVQAADRWLMLSGEGHLAVAGDQGKLSGKLIADAGWWRLPDADRPRLSDDVIIRGAGAPRRAANKLGLDLEVDLGQRFFLAGRGLDTRLVGSVRLSGGDDAPLAATGTLRTRAGSFDAYGRALSIERGIVSFQGALDNPALNIVAVRKNLPVEAGVEILGTAQRPRIRLISEPDVPDAEKLSWIVLGRGQEDTGSGDAAALIAAAGAILGGPGGGISRQLANQLGLDEIALGTARPSTSTSQLPRRTVAGGSGFGGEPLGEQVVSFGKRLSQSAYLSYEHGLAGAGGMVKLTVGLGRRLSLVGRAGADNALDLLYMFSFD